MKALMNSLHGCKTLHYIDEPNEFDTGIKYNQVTYQENSIQKLRLLNNIKALADVARSRCFTEDTSDRELISDIFTEIFIKCNELETLDCYGMSKEEGYVAEDLAEETLHLRPRAINSRVDNEVRLLHTGEKNIFILRLGNNDYVVELADSGIFIINGTKSDTVTFNEKIKI